MAMLKSTPLLTFPTLEDKHFRAVGHVVLQWAHIERELTQEVLILLTRPLHAGELVNFQSRFSTRANRWTDLATPIYTRHPNDMKTIRRIASDAVTIKIERDDIAHGTWAGGDFFKFKNGRLVDMPDKLRNAEEIEDLACRISEIGAALLDFQIELNSLYPWRVGC
jgi:hypothetical protein